jgi:hypothetical protein
MLKYNASRDPDPTEWLEADDGSRLWAIQRHHEKRQSHEMPPGGWVGHSILHAAVECQIAEGNPEESRTTLSRLQRQGLTRHEAVHAIASVLAVRLWEAARGTPYDEAAYVRALNELTPESWEEMAEE